MQFPIRMELRRSRLLACMTVLLHALAAACLLLLPWPAEGRYALLMVVALSTWHVLRPSTILGLRLGERGELALLYRDGVSLAASVQADSAVFSQLIVLRVRVDNQGPLQNLALLPDSMPAEQFRVLRLWLRWLADPSERRAGGV